MCRVLTEFTVIPGRGAIDPGNEAGGTGVTECCSLDVLVETLRTLCANIRSRLVLLAGRAAHCK